MIINIQDDILILHNHGILKRLLEDKTTKKNIMWATDAYNDYGVQYYRNEEIKPELITGKNSDIIKTRARKELEKQFERTRQRAEVFTPLWICKRMNDDAEKFWFEDNVVDTVADENADYMELVLNDYKLFKKYIDSKRLEITCGEAPYLVSRYDVANGEMIPVSKRIGILDRKLQAVGRYAESEEEWFKWVIRAYQATFGYEFQGDNVLIARVNLLMSLDDYMEDRWCRKPTDKEREKIANIVSWNIWQMDGLTYTIPYSKAEKHIVQLDIFGFLQDEEGIDFHEDVEAIKIQPNCRIYDWHNKKKSIELQELRKGMHMKFDFIIGNPPYQETRETTKDMPIYHEFMNSAFEISDKVLLITPGRFLFNAGATPKKWNKQMLDDEHFKVLLYERDSSKIFSNTMINGGIAITYRDANKELGPIGTFTPFPELNTIKDKVRDFGNFVSINTIMYPYSAYTLSEALWEEFPERKKRVEYISKHRNELSTEEKKGELSNLRIITTNIFDLLSDLFYEQAPEDGQEYCCIVGRKNNQRCNMYILKKYIDVAENYEKYKVILSIADGAAGQIGKPVPARIIGAPSVIGPMTGYTQTFQSIGAVDTEAEAIAISKYVKTKFLRVLLGILKITQHYPQEKWEYVPLEDFTYNSDIDWSLQVSEIDRQLYEKYGLDQNEIDFIESHVKEMK